MSSSSARPPKPEPLEAPAAGTYIDWGPALPETYGLSRVAALVRDPGHFFVFWEGGESLRARNLTDGSSRDRAVPGAGSLYLDGVPEHEYEVDLLREGRVVAVSNRVRLPRRAPAVAVDEDWVPTADQAELLRQLAGGLETLMREEVEALNSELLRRRAGATPWPSSPGKR
jgi:hypothetical protein